MIRSSQASSASRSVAMMRDAQLLAILDGTNDTLMLAMMAHA